MLYRALVEKFGLIVQYDQFKNLRKCDYCDKPKNIKETYWKLHERPIRGRKRRNCGPTRVQVELSETPNTPTIGVFSNEEIQTMKRILSQFNFSSSIGTINLVKS